MKPSEMKIGQKFWGILSMARSDGEMEVRYVDGKRYVHFPYLLERHLIEYEIVARRVVTFEGDWPSKEQRDGEGQMITLVHLNRIVRAENPQSYEPKAGEYSRFYKDEFDDKYHFTLEEAETAYGNMKLYDEEIVDATAEPEGN